LRRALYDLTNTYIAPKPVTAKARVSGSICKEMLNALVRVLHWPAMFRGAKPQTDAAYRGQSGAIKTRDFPRASPVRNCAKLCCLLAIQATNF